MFIHVFYTHTHVFVLILRIRFSSFHSTFGDFNFRCLFCQLCAQCIHFVRKLTELAIKLCQIRL